eukprot:m.88843 g.88843  ORF g.88843 m.88843 type:complete len:829 (-) comp14837_c0_seq1:100-2586(-)
MQYTPAKWRNRLLALILAICSGSTTPTHPKQASTLGCRKTPGQRVHLTGNATFYDVVIPVDGLYRRFRVLPAQSSFAPLVVGFHGCGSNLTKFEGEAQFFHHGRRSNVNMIAPLGLNMQPYDPERTKISLGFNPSFERCYTLGLVDDVAFVNAVLDWAQNHLCHDPNRVYAIGTSNGAAMVINLTCSLPHRFTAFAYTGGVMRDSHFPYGPSCHRDPALVRPILAAVGGGDRYRKGLLLDFASKFGKQAKCYPEAQILKPTTNTKCTRYNGCQPSGKGRVELCEIGHLDHCWAGTRCCDPQCNATASDEDLALTPYMLSWLADVSRHFPNPTQHYQGARTAVRPQHMFVVTVLLLVLAVGSVLPLLRQYSRAQGLRQTMLVALITAAVSFVAFYIYSYMYLGLQLLRDPLLDTCPHHTPRSVFRYYYHLQEPVQLLTTWVAVVAVLGLLVSRRLRFPLVNIITNISLLLAVMGVMFLLSSALVADNLPSQYLRCENTALDRATVATSRTLPGSRGFGGLIHGNSPPIDMPVIVVARKPSCVNSLVIRRLLQRLALHQQVMIVAPAQLCQEFTSSHGDRVRCVAEDFAAGITPQELARYFERRGLAPYDVYKGRTLVGWYLQQFAKLLAFRLLGPKMPQHVLLWDGDMLMSDRYQPLTTEGQIRLHVGGLIIDDYSHVFHARTQLPLLFTSRWESLVTHHTVVDTGLMAMFLEDMQLASINISGALNPDAQGIFSLLDLISDHRMLKGFSEYGSWASWLLHRHPHRVAVVPQRRWSRQLPEDLLTAIAQSPRCCPTATQEGLLMKYLHKTEYEFVGFEAGHMPQCAEHS